MKNWLRYDEMVDEALRGVVKQALKEAATKGLHGDHHFYISFQTHKPGVVIPKYLYSKYPEEMTIVLQHQFWDLKIGDIEFSVTLSFNGKPEQLIIPWQALTNFADPSVKFALQFEAVEEDLPAAVPELLLEQPAVAQSDPDADDQKPTGAEIVALDQFRKK